MNIDNLIAWHRRSGNRAELDQKNAQHKATSGRCSPHTQEVWASDAVRYQDLVIFHRNAVKLLESINHEQTV